MVITKEQAQDFEQVTRPVREWLMKNTHPHTAVIITAISAELMEGICMAGTSPESS